MSSEQNSEFYVGWGTLALLNGNIAQIKGRNGFAWFLGSLLGGPLVTLLLSLVRPAPPALPGG